MLHTYDRNITCVHCNYKYADEHKKKVLRNRYLHIPYKRTVALRRLANQFNYIAAITATATVTTVNSKSCYCSISKKFPNDSRLELSPRTLYCAVGVVDGTHYIIQGSHYFLFSDANGHCSPFIERTYLFKWDSFLY